jgi:diguanylate cyclase
VQALYPLGDIALLSSVLFLVLSPGRNGPATRLLVAGASLTLAMDLAFAVVPVHWPSFAVERLDGLLLIANAMIVGAVLHPRRADLVTPVHVTVESLHPARVLFLGLALLTAPLMAVLDDGQNRKDYIIVGACVITVAFTLARFTGAVREQSRMQRLLAHLADHDALTGLPNRRMFVERLDREFSPAAETVVMYLDLDGFKAINDEYGHAAGDAVLVEVARRVRAAIRRDDLPVRLGGDEFAVLCPGLDTAAGHALAERLVAAVAEPILFGAHELRVGASVGMSGARGCGSGGELIARADHAMLDAKRAGRGRAVVAV